ncbi:MAG: ATP-dependent DNA helicase RecG [Patescibacteria group bacterium]
MKLSDPIGKAPKIGAKYKAKLKKMEIRTIGDLLFHFPSRYEDFSQITKISNLSPKKQATIKGEVKVINSGKTSKKKIPYTEALLQDESGPIKIIWFYQPYLAKTIKKGEEIFISGKPKYGNEGLQFVNPSYEKVKKNTIHTGGLVAIYPETEGVSSRWLRYVIKSLLEEFSSKVTETLPRQIIKKYNLLPISKALRKIHFPSSWAQAKQAQKRFAFERLFFIQLASLKKRMNIKREDSTPVEVDMDYVKDFVSSLPFNLTDPQRKSAWQILQDIQKPHPMNRLLEGDVGSGKTVVAAIATLATTKGSYQVAFMAPTEVLATQHFKKISTMLEGFRLNIGFLTGKKDKFKSKKLKNQFIEISREKLLEKVEDGEMDILIGTHALIQDKVTFDRLGLVIVDEQHRFGVKQRAKLCKKDVIPHLLSMTATPIPRTLALTLYGDLDISIIDELPAGRKKIKTEVVNEKKRNEVYSFTEKELNKGRQVFVICPRIEESDEDDKTAWAEVTSVEETTKKLKKEFSEYTVEPLHGNLSSTKKAKIMERFKNKKIDILVSTSVIEVGVDIPNATVMIIESAEMFGLAQLHQFRGRVGRSDYQSYCFLFSGSNSEKSRKRLKALVESEDSFELAERDLELRGPGDLAGKRQWGVASFTMEALKNRKLVQETKEAAKDILESDYNLSNHKLIKKKLKSVERNLHFE